ncbi:sigma-70 family RNA polymerase sigma factor [Ferruginibacter sp.]
MMYFLKLWLHRDRLKEIQQLNAYLFKMAQNTAFNGLRSLAKRTLLTTELDKATVPESGNPDDKLVRKEVLQLIHNAVGKLTPQQKEVFKMSREEGLKQEDIAKRLGISIFTVKRHLTDALNHLRKEITETYGSKAVALCVILSLSLS